MSIWNRKKDSHFSQENSFDGKIYFGDYCYYLSIIPKSKFTKSAANGFCYLDVFTTKVYVINGFIDTTCNRKFLMEFLEDGQVYITKFYKDSKGRIRETKKECL